ncbi:nitrate- and nitrite sensing domain-containing protein (plasmid) [Streptomyces sp. HUAS 31]|uniref:sensor histidine kinase n=1 Tax=Streptomyces sp. HUAS 31 TaxID=3020055 RepID=UPI002304D658|nr:nitrate- and nitrite sensing domain-containing protein [Streptomyces sp. HUAS 31]WCE02415.1 nitrate- and nitrite sensing domain-containing protein [Streptomyces sp. HUAS 31]
MSRWTGARRRLGSIRLSLILLALVPSITLAAFWGMTSVEIRSDGLRLRAQTELSRTTGNRGADVLLALQRERKLSASRLATPRTPGAALDEQRVRTDAALAGLTAQKDSFAEVPRQIAPLLEAGLTSLEDVRSIREQVDDPAGTTAEKVLARYDSMLDTQIQAYQGLLSQVDGDEPTSQADLVFAFLQAAELLSRQDARLALARPSGRFDEQGWADFTKLAHARRWLAEDQLEPMLSAAGLETGQDVRSPQWRTLREIEDQVLKAHHPGGEGHIDLPRGQQRWDAATAEVATRYGTAIRQQTDALLHSSAERADGLVLTATAQSAGGLLALLLCAGMSWRITRSLSRRLRGLRKATLNLAEERLPDVVARLERGEKVDAESATEPLEYGYDELGQVAQAFNTAQRTAVLTTVELARTRSGFQKVILGIARQSQNLVNRQLGKLDTLERRHSDPEILKELYELDSIASQLRRYEENLVVVSGERPGRTWSEPVAVTDIVRAAIGEVAEYQRVEMHTEEEVALAPPAVADVIHLLAELIDNATAYSPAPSPVTVRATLVAMGLAVEVEDRGLGLGEDDYATLNAQLAQPMQFDVVALAEDLRLGMFVVSQLAHRHGVTVTLRRSPYGGTTALVLIPRHVVVRDSGTAPARATAAYPGGPGVRGPATTGVPGPATAAGAGAGPVRGGAPDPTAVAGTATVVTPAATTADAPSVAAVGAPGSERSEFPPLPPGPAPGTLGPAVSGRRSAQPPDAGTRHGQDLVPLPRRVPRTSLAAGGAAHEWTAEPADTWPKFSAEAAGASLAGFQRGTLRARDADAATER